MKQRLRWLLEEWGWAFGEHSDGWTARGDGWRVEVFPDSVALYPRAGVARYHGAEAEDLAICLLNATREPVEA